MPYAAGAITALRASASADTAAAMEGSFYSFSVRLKAASPSRPANLASRRVQWRSRLAEGGAKRS
jgi:hypothetical protein